MPGHNKASWEALAGQADALRWRANVIWKMQILPMLREAEEKYILAEKEKGSPIPRAYKEYHDVDGLV